MKKQTLLKLASALSALASVPFLWVYGAYRWAMWRGGKQHQRHHRGKGA